MLLAKKGKKFKCIGLLDLKLSSWSICSLPRAKDGTRLPVPNCLAGWWCDATATIGSRFKLARCPWCPWRPVWWHLQQWSRLANTWRISLPKAYCLHCLECMLRAFALMPSAYVFLIDYGTIWRYRLKAAFLLSKDALELIAQLLRSVAGIGVIVAGSQAQEISCCSFGRCNALSLNAPTRKCTFWRVYPTGK